MFLCLPCSICNEWLEHRSLAIDLRSSKFEMLRYGSKPCSYLLMWDSTEMSVNFDFPTSSENIGRWWWNNSRKKGKIFLIFHLPKLGAFRMIQFLKYEKNYQIFISYYLSFCARSTDVRTGKSIHKLPSVLWFTSVESRNIFLATSEIFRRRMPQEKFSLSFL